MFPALNCVLRVLYMIYIEQQTPTRGHDESCFTLCVLVRQLGLLWALGYRSDNIFLAIKLYQKQIVERPHVPDSITWQVRNSRFGTSRFDTISNLHKNFDHFKYSLRVNKKTNWDEYRSLFTPRTWNYLHLDWMTGIERTDNPGI